MFFNKQVTVVRSLAGAYNEDGVWQDGQTQELTILANVQPLNQREVEQYTSVLPGGNRTNLLVKIYIPGNDPRRLPTCQKIFLGNDCKPINAITFDNRKKIKDSNAFARAGFLHRIRLQRVELRQDAISIFLYRIPTFVLCLIGTHPHRVQIT